MKKYGFGNYGLALLLVMTFSQTGCDESDSDSPMAPLKVELWGEEFIEQGIPAVEFADGYEVSFQKFLISLGAVTVAESPGDQAVASFSEQKIWDLTKTGPFEVGQALVQVGAFKNTGYAIRNAHAQAVAGNGSPTDVQMMAQNQYSVYVEGTATLGADTWTFAWGFQNNTVYGPCHSSGVVAETTGGSVQITIHGDHLFYDSAVSSEPSLRFADLAMADSNGDGNITPEELVAYPLAPLAYYMAPEDSGVKNMWQYVSYMISTLGHIDGEGHCETN